jgi:hypothetical protein
MLMFPVIWDVARINRVASRAAPAGGWDDVFDEKVRDADGAEHVLYFPEVAVFAQFMPPSATDHANMQVPMINGNDMSFKFRWALSKIDLTAKSLIDAATGRPLIQPGDRIMRSRDRDNGSIYESFEHVELVVHQFQQRQGNDDNLFVVTLQDVSKASNILS